MNRVIVSENFSADTPAPTAAAATPAAQQPPQPQERPPQQQLQLEPRDALAGALPAWDLLPATPFIRRVK